MIQATSWAVGYVDNPQNLISIRDIVFKSVSGPKSPLFPQLGIILDPILIQVIRVEIKLDVLAPNATPTKYLTAWHLENPNASFDNGDHEVCICSRDIGTPGELVIVVDDAMGHKNDLLRTSIPKFHASLLSINIAILDEADYALMQITDLRVPYESKLESKRSISHWAAFVVSQKTQLLDA
jgi:hypothetical protein